MESTYIIHFNLLGRYIRLACSFLRLRRAVPSLFLSLFISQPFLRFFHFLPPPFARRFRDPSSCFGVALIPRHRTRRVFLYQWKHFAKLHLPVPRSAPFHVSSGAQGISSFTFGQINFTGSQLVSYQIVPPLRGGP